MSTEFKEIELEKISANPYQPRSVFCRKEIEGLAQSIRSVGLIQPPVVCPLDEEGRYALISGERRFRAAELAGLKTIPVIIQEHQDRFSAEASLVENIQRVDLNPLEIAKALARLAEEFSYQQEELAERVGKSRSTVANYLRLLSLPKKIQESLSANAISMGHAKAILSVDGFERQLMLHDQVVAEELSVRETEQAAQQIGKNTKRRLASYSNSPDCYLQDLQDMLQHKLGTKVSIQSRGKRGRISIDYYNLDDLDRILETIAGGAKRL